MPMQAKKVRRVQSAFELFNGMMQTPGKSELTLTELRVRQNFCNVIKTKSCSTYMNAFGIYSTFLYKQCTKSIAIIRTKC